MRIALDTTRYIDLCRGDPEVVRIVEEADWVALPFVALAELRAGFATGTHGPENERVLQSFLLKPDVDVLWADDATTRCYANLYRQLKQQGTALSSNALWIAALVIEHNLVLVTRDTHFHHLPQLQLLSPPDA